ncbi:hypothetical protein K458DRAFT_415448 [Lentithecium fluviatile CBS 122367]|uniref:Uncharacterized protein n=1 Tax=Lentithecium fluviatile CBS 122367 TaxID=1168545 RepID=A0A6G1J9U5_9PLEO|nr:hypothetical protein K458DRAFT_415448 [Lentithecium fluviatile CBS 122367]
MMILSAHTQHSHSFLKPTISTQQRDCFKVRNQTSRIHVYLSGTRDNAQTQLWRRGKPIAL